MKATHALIDEWNINRGQIEYGTLSPEGSARMKEIEQELKKREVIVVYVGRGRMEQRLI